MRSNYPFSTIEFNDVILSAYENMVYLLGVRTDVLNVTGVYDQIDSSGLAFMTNGSGIPHCGTSEENYDLGSSYNNSSEVVINTLRGNYIINKFLGVF
jgi:hypothetical protein